MKGSFPCGSNISAVESRSFKIPNEIHCDRCVLEFVYRTPDGFEIRQCSDMAVAGGDEAQCFGKCLNGGVCKHGKCECKPGYSGEFCENAPGNF